MFYSSVERTRPFPRDSPQVLCGPSRRAALSVSPRALSPLISRPVGSSSTRCARSLSRRFNFQSSGPAAHPLRVIPLGGPVFDVALRFLPGQRNHRGLCWPFSARPPEIATTPAPRPPRASRPRGARKSIVAINERATSLKVPASVTPR